MSARTDLLAIRARLQAQLAPLQAQLAVIDKALELFPDDTSTTVSVGEGAPVAAPVPVSVVVSAAPEGHRVTWNPPLSATGEGTTFGLNPDGSNDPEDDGVGFFKDPATGKPYDTRNKSLMGFSLPREILLSTFGLASGPWTSNAATTSVWDLQPARVRQYVTENKVTVLADCHGKSFEGPLCDAGPAGWHPQTGQPLGNLVDLTYALTQYFHTGGKAIVTLAIMKNGQPMEIKGWDFQNRRIS